MFLPAFKAFCAGIGWLVNTIKRTRSVATTPRAIAAEMAGISSAITTVLKGIIKIFAYVIVELKVVLPTLMAVSARIPSHWRYAVDDGDSPWYLYIKAFVGQFSTETTEPISPEERLLEALHTNHGITPEMMIDAYEALESESGILSPEHITTLNKLEEVCSRLNCGVGIGYRSLNEQELSALKEEEQMQAQQDLLDALSLSGQPMPESIKHSFDEMLTEARFQSLAGI